MKKQILELFTQHKELSFADIEKKLAIRSNKLAYHLNKLVHQEMLSKEENKYTLSEITEPLLPYTSDKMQVIPVVLIYIGDKKKAFLIQRKKRPYQHLLGLPGGRLIIGESLKEAAKRIMKKKFNLDIKAGKILSIYLEHVKKKEKIMYSFLLMTIEAKAFLSVSLSDIEKNKKKIIRSDYHIITQASQKNKIETIISREN